MDENLKKIMFRTKYRINETPNYRLLNDLEFDNVPDNTYMTQDGMPTPNIAGSDAYIEEDEENPIENSDNLDDMGDNPDNANNNNDIDNDKTNIETPEKDVDLGIDEPDTNSPELGDNPEFQNEKDINKVQNDIIKHNIEATKLLNNQIETLNNIVVNIDSKFKELTSKVKEVEEPSNAEKLMSKKDQSYPYYFNLNDFWDENWFEQKHKKEDVVDGIKKLADGTYVADFDDINLNNDYTEY